MIRWYDYIAAFVFADLATALFFGLPGFGMVAAYLLIFYAWDYYCEWRKYME